MCKFWIDYSSANVQMVDAKWSPGHATEADGEHETNDNLKWTGAHNHDEHEEALGQQT